MKILSLLSAVAAWSLAVVLVMQLLSGNFETRTCQTDCVQNIFWISLSLCVLGLIVGLVFIKKPKPNLVIFSNISLSVLFFMYLTMIGIGTFG